MLHIMSDLHLHTNSTNNSRIMCNILFTLYFTFYFSIELVASSEAENWFVVCASGVTCGGKTTITRSLHDKLNSSILIRQDDYYLPDNDPRHVQLPGLQWRNRELMSSLDMQQMRSDIEELLCR